MEKYLGVKLIEAREMNIFQAAAYLNRNLSNGKEPIADTPGYLVMYENGYESWSPKDAFEKAYRKIDALNFGLALEALKKGLRVARKGWFVIELGKTMFLIYKKTNIKHRNYTSNLEFRDYLKNSGTEYFTKIPHIDLYVTPVNNVPVLVVGWHPTQTDMLADDWFIIE